MSQWSVDRQPIVPMSDRSIDVAIAKLEELAQGAKNSIASHSEFAAKRNAYLTWVHQAELHLRSLFLTPHQAEDLFSERHWRIRDLNVESPRWGDVLSAEVETQHSRLVAIATRLRSDLDAWASIPEDVALVAIDTNVFLHLQFFNEVDWPAVVASKKVHLVVPLVVIDELDEKSYASAARSDRAKQVLRALQKARSGAAPHQPVEIRARTALQILGDPVGHGRQSNNDGEFLDRVDYLRALVGPRVRVASADYGMQLRAQIRSLPCVDLDALRLDRATDG